jgi:hypothetical protein
LATAQKVIATTKASEASTSASAASTSASAAGTARDAALAALDSFDDRYLGQKSASPNVDNDGDALANGSLYFDTTSGVMKVYDGTNWLAAYASLSGTLVSTANLSDLSNAPAARGNLGLGTAALSAAADFATAAQADQTVALTGAGATSISGTYPNFTVTSTDSNTTYTIQDGELSQNNFTNADHTKLDGIASSANNYVLPFTDNAANWNTSYTYSQVGHLPLAGGTLTGALVLNNTGSLKVAAGTTGQREGSPAAGMFRYNTTDGKFEGYSTEWGEIGGGGEAADFSLNAFTGNGSTVAYTLSTSPTEDNTLVYIDGVYQNKTSYAIVNNVLTFSAAPPNTSAIEITAATTAPVAASTEFKLSQFTGNGSTTAFTLSAQSPENNTNVYMDGVYQSKSNYSVSGTTLSFSTAPPNGSAVEVMAAHAVIVSVSTPDDGTVTTAKIVDANVTTAKIADANVTTAKLLDANVTTAKIANDAVTADKIASEAIAVGITSVVTATSLTATVNTHVYVSAAGQTITLPASPTIGQRVLVTVGNFVNTVVGRNSSNIMSSGTDMTLDSAYLSIQFIYTDATQGWVMS